METFENDILGNIEEYNTEYKRMKIPAIMLQ